MDMEYNIYVEPLKEMLSLADRAMPVYAVVSPLGRSKFYPICEACQDVDNALDAETSCFVITSYEANAGHTAITKEQLLSALDEAKDFSPILLLDGGSLKDFMPVRRAIGAYEYAGKFVIVAGDVIEEE